MVRKRKIKKDIDQQLLRDIQHLRQEWATLNNIIQHSVEPTEEGLKDLNLTKAKYFYLLREARKRNINALSG
ncbi:YaaL family protein [Thalassobacillus sp. CUG 92003]|uniref:YaaL family protein n=1 Tax=Thalassobacillus sp. CUG 92003 TaxID=2736641 RepID=UPI0015E6916E|nr:YaaL family protein [Thalassobacillus sp. CUG 92003]